MARVFDELPQGGNGIKRSHGGRLCREHILEHKHYPGEIIERKDELLLNPLHSGRGWTVAVIINIADAVRTDLIDLAGMSGGIE